MPITFSPMANSKRDTDELVRFLTTNRFPFHVLPEHSEESAREAVASGRFWSGESHGYWIDDDGARIGLVVLDDLDEDTPMFDLRLAEAFRGKGLGPKVLAALCTKVFEQFPEPVRFEGQTREDNIAMRKTFLRAGFLKEAHYRLGWPTAEGPRVASVAYAILRQDWESKDTTGFEWHDLPA
ncbi:GNAT family protein [Arthrobacter sp. zg-Y820]|uniref:GNAT family N-acetyltransferase n=1 Tax=unclassified Arthrobacter TaxID=235627 RepID=UPI001E636B0D|nr:MULTISPECIES: GNAT family protein [unclassified Arthrobacter]MCC9197159.1 GNAT family N-acetyltransferase [Arthrobacter sp. zg-Y820]MDK1280024.1 GNAT family protein [Arthrobacter sp. zg.Y820]WIB09319.1 GNAT family protein [Arthrobacter sp. zg-Y820]